MAKQPKQSAVVQLLQTVWDNANKATGHSWERLNHAMYNALRLAIGAGFVFTAGDFKALDNFHKDYWISDSTEWCYSMAMVACNWPAAKAYEEWVGREPLIADDVTPSEGHGRYTHGIGTRQSDRLHVGCYFWWQGEKVKVTSFNPQGSAVACSYHPCGRGKDGYVHGYESKIKRRYCITRDGIVADRAERKERAALLKQLSAIAAKKNGKAAEIHKVLGVQTPEALDVMPLQKLRKAAAKVLAVEG